VLLFNIMFLLFLYLDYFPNDRIDNSTTRKHEQAYNYRIPIN